MHRDRVVGRRSQEHMRDLRSLVRIQIVFTIFFVFFKFIRPPVLKSDAPDVFKLILLSLPNFFEGVIGTLILTYIGLYLNERVGKKRIGEMMIYVSAVVIAGVYVITQELKFHNFGGNNVMDPNDVVGSVIGLMVGFAIIICKRPRIQADEQGGSSIFKCRNR